MTPSLRTTVLAGWFVIGLEGFIVASSAIHEWYGIAGLAGLVAWLILMLEWGLGQSARWCDLKLREARAKAELSELLLAKVREGDELNLRFAIPLDHGEGTKH